VENGMEFKADNTMFGDPNDFAIEAGAEPGLAPPSPVWGHACVWCRGMPLGNIDDRHCGLAGTFHGFADLAEHVDELWNEKLVGLDDHALWNFLDGLLYGYHGDVEIEDDRSLQQIGKDAIHFG
jgi:hypothetical protein